jgi:hypothetical protein
MLDAPLVFFSKCMRIILSALHPPAPHLPGSRYRNSRDSYRFTSVRVVLAAPSFCSDILPSVHVATRIAMPSVCLHRGHGGLETLSTLHHPVYIITPQAPTSKAPSCPARLDALSPRATSRRQSYHGSQHAFRTEYSQSTRRLNLCPSRHSEPSRQISSPKWSWAVQCFRYHQSTRRLNLYFEPRPSQYMASNSVSSPAHLDTPSPCAADLVANISKTMPAHSLISLSRHSSCLAPHPLSPLTQGTSSARAGAPWRPRARRRACTRRSADSPRPRARSRACKTRWAGWRRRRAP